MFWVLNRSALPISILGMSGFEILIFLEKMAKLFANCGDPDQTPHSLYTQHVFVE